MSTQWLLAIDCPLLQTADDSADIAKVRLVQRLLEIALPGRNWIQRINSSL
jgi:hypothetical protein